MVQSIVVYICCCLHNLNLLLGWLCRCSYNRILLLLLACLGDDHYLPLSWCLLVPFPACHKIPPYHILTSFSLALYNFLLSLWTFPWNPPSWYPTSTTLSTWYHWLPAAGPNYLAHSSPNPHDFSNAQTYGERRSSYHQVVIRSKWRGKSMKNLEKAKKSRQTVKLYCQKP